MTDNQILLVAIGNPKSLLRSRAKVLHLGKKTIPQIYEPAENEEAKLSLYAQVRDKAPESPPVCAVMVSVMFIMARPLGHYGTGRNRGILKDQMKNTRHISKPDPDNLGKLVLDALTGVFWHDDAQIDDVHFRKRYATGEQPRTTIQITYDERT